MRRFREAGVDAGFAWPDTLEGLIAFAQEHGRRFFEKHGKWPGRTPSHIDGLLGATWQMLDSVFRNRYSIGLQEVFQRTPRGRRTEAMAGELRDFIDAKGREPLRTSEFERRLSNGLNKLRSRHPDLCDKYNIPRRADRSAISRRANNKPQLAIETVVLWLCADPAATAATRRIGGVRGGTLNSLLEHASDPVRRGASRGLGTTPEAIRVLCQVNSLARLKRERDADCWRLWLDGADAPDPRPWADILAAGDNKHVVKAERVAFLDWTDLDKNGKPKRKPWKPPTDRTPPHDAATPAKTSRPKAGNRAAKAQKNEEKRA